MYAISTAGRSPSRHRQERRCVEPATAMAPRFQKGGSMSKLEERIEIANPQQPHVATVLLLDTSGSMSGGKIAALNEGLTLFKQDVSTDDLACKRVDLAVVTFGSSVSVLHDFASIEDFDPPELAADGATPMGAAILKAGELVEQRKGQYKAQGTDYYRPWILLITDGEPTDMQPGDEMWKQVVRVVHDGEASRKFMFFAVAVEPANVDVLLEIAPPGRPPVKLKGQRFKE